MKQVLFCLLAIIFCVQLASCQLYGVANMSSTGIGASYNVGGYVSFSQATADALVTVTVNITGNFEPRLYAVHVHTYGDLSNALNASSVGTHYVGRGNTSHGCPEFQGDVRHEGDMGNFQGTTTGITGTKTLNLLTLSGNFSIIGRAVILHLNQDNCTNDPPNGGAGIYIGSGVIGIQNSTINTATNNDTTITTAVVNLYPTYLASNYCSAICGARFNLTQNPSGISFSGQVYGLLSNTARGLHVHTYGDLSTPATGLSVGGHWNPTGANHGLPGTNPRHLGDLGSIQSFGNDGLGYYQATFPTEEVGTLSSIIGRGIVIHALSDKGNGAGCDQAGNSGTRILWGVIGAKNPAVPGVIVATDVVINNNYTAVPCVTPSPAPVASSSPVGGSGSMIQSWYTLLF